MNTQQSRYLELFNYCQETGTLRWRMSVGSRAREGDIAGTKTAKGYVCVRVDGRLLLVHQVAWVIVYGSMPSGVISHLNGDNTDNRLANLATTTRKVVARTLKAPPLNAENVRQVFEYKNGGLFWRESLTGKSRIAGKEAGHLNQDGYVVIQVATKGIGAHRIVWLMHHGAWPTGEIDHLNSIRHDNRIENLRDVAHITNSENRRSSKIDSKTGVLGVTEFKGGKYRARIRTKGILVSLGIFDTAEQAHSAYVDAKRKLHSGCTL